MKLENLGFPQAALAVLPTPLDEAPRFARAIGDVRVFIKRDDETGLALGGNKARKLELLVGEALAMGCDTLITCGGPQSNHARMTAAAARKHGLYPVLALDSDDPGTRQGNLLLDSLLGAEVVFAGGGREGEDIMPAIAERLRNQGKKPYIIPLGGSNPLGALGYVSCVEEMVDQGEQAGVMPVSLYAAAGSCGTLAGLILGKILFDAPFEVLGVAVSETGPVKEAKALKLVLETAALLKSHAVPAAHAKGVPARYAKPFERLLGISEESVRPHVRVTGSQVGKGYGIPTEAGLEAISLLARNEGVLTDPVYTGKALAGLIQDVRSGVYKPGEAVAFLHSGGVPADFAYADIFTNGRNQG